MPSYPTDNLKDASGNAIAATDRTLDNVTDRMEQKDSGNTTAPSTSTDFRTWGDDITLLTDTVKDLTDTGDTISITATASTNNSSLTALLNEIKKLYAYIGKHDYACTAADADNIITYSDATFPFVDGDPVLLDATKGNMTGDTTVGYINSLNTTSKTFKLVDAAGDQITVGGEASWTSTNVYMQAPSSAELKYFADLECLKYNDLNSQIMTLAFRIKRFADTIHTLNLKGALPQYTEGSEQYPSERLVFTK